MNTINIQSVLDSAKFSSFHWKILFWTAFIIVFDGFDLVIYGNNGNKKDTCANVLETGEFVVNMVTEELADKMNKTSAALAHGVDEFAFAGLTAIDSVVVKPPRVKESLIQFECKLVHHYAFKDKQNGSTYYLAKYS